MIIKSHRLVASLVEAKCLPTFEVRQLKSAPGWYVRVSWRYGQVEHISGFASGHDAENWIKEKSAEWGTK